MGTPHERADVIAAVYRRYREVEQSGALPSARAIAREFGLSPPTVKRYVELGRHAEQWRVAYDRVQMTTVVHEALEELLEDALADSRAARDGRERAQHRMVVIGAIREIKSLHGLNMPARVHFTNDNDARPDPDLVAAVSDEIRELNERERRRALDPARDEED